MTAGDIYAIGFKTSLRFGLGMGNVALRIDPAGNLVVASSSDGHQANRLEVLAVRTGAFYGQQMTAGHLYALSTPGAAPEGVAVDGAGNLVMADIAASLVRVLAVKTGTFYGQQMTAGGVYTIAGGGTSGLGDGGPATSAQLSLRRRGSAVAVDSAGNVAVADSGDSRVRVVAVSSGTFYGQQMTAGDIYTIAGTGAAGFSGDGGLAPRAELGGSGVASDPAGDVVTWSFARVRFAPARSGSYFGQAMAGGHIYTIAGDGSLGFTGDGAPATQAEIGGGPIALDHAGNLVLADYDAGRVRVVAVTTGTFYGQQMTAGDIYTIAGGPPIPCSPFPGDGGPALGTQICGPNALTVDNAGILLISDSGYNRVRAVAARTGTFYGQQMTAGDIYTIAGNGKQGVRGDGGPATKAELELAPDAGLAVDSEGNLMVTEPETLRMVAARPGTFYGQKMTKGDIYTIAREGRPFPGYVDCVTVDRTRNVIMNFGDLVKVLAARSGTFYGRTMTASHLYTVAGGGRPVLGEGGPATAVSLIIGGLAVTGPSGFLIADASGLGRIRKVSR